MAEPIWNALPYRIGCPVWACRTWANQVYPEGTPADRILEWYSRSFPTVEGNSTFYAVPPISTFEKWRDNAAEGFQFCFKFPRLISHDRRLESCDELLKDWLTRLEILFEVGKLGPTFLQLAPSFSFARFPHLAQFLKKLPASWPWAVEVRHSDWFDGGERESKLNELLTQLGIDRVLFDSRPLHSMSANDSTEATSQTRKPKSPFRVTTTGKRPMVRLIGRNSLSEIAEYWESWALQIAEWVRAGYQPWIFTHAPDDTFAPLLARHLHGLIQLEIPELPGLPEFDSRQIPSLDSGNSAPKQLPLF